MEYNSFNRDNRTQVYCSGEQRLCMAVIIQAIKDIHYSDEKRKSLGRKLPPRAGKEARQWVLSNSSSPFSFIWCLEHVFLESYEYMDVEAVRKIILSKQLLCKSVTMCHAGCHAGSGRKPLSRYIE